MAEKDLYKMLGVARDAKADEIKRAYRRLARQYHPDVNPGDKAAEEKFKEINFAFDILGDAEKRKLYDELGMDAAKIGWDPKKAEELRRWRRGAGGGGGFRFEGFDDAFGGGSGATVDFGDLFGDLFGDVFARGAGAAPFHRRRRGPTPGDDVGARIEVDLVDVIRGAEKEIEVQKPGGRSRLKVRIPAGIADGGKVRLAGQGGPGYDGGPPGDLYLEVRVREHPLVRREGDDLHLQLPLTVGEAVAGATIRLPTFDGPVDLRVPAGMQTGRKLRLRGKGVPHLRGGGRGDLYAEAKVIVPTKSGAEEAARALDAFYEGDVRRGLAL